MRWLRGFPTLFALLVVATAAHTDDVVVQLSAGDGFVVQDNTGTVERLRVDEATGNVSRNGALFVHTTGTDNTFVGERAGNLGTGGSSNNSAFGADALRSNTNGALNSAFGGNSLFSNTTGGRNSAFGEDALFHNTTGGLNSAFGEDALQFNTTGSRNVGVGRRAGRNQTTGNDNIYLANVGVAAESGQIKIGTQGTHTDTFIAGIAGNVVSGSTVIVDGNGQLGVVASSLRFKLDVRDMGGASQVLMQLRPVTFTYREEVVGADGQLQYGLIAEEVVDVEPGLVGYDEKGAPYTVRYDALAPMLLNETQKQQRTIEAQEAALEALTARLAMLEARLEAQLQKMVR
jgi:hypothetical protein